MDNAKLKHLEFIQNVITRMGHNSFLIKGWCVTILSALVVVTVKEKCYVLFLISILPIICFWFLDSYYLQQERRFRVLYDEACEEDFQLFSMDPSSKTLSANKKKLNYWNVVMSKTILVLYLSLVIMLLFLYFVFA